ncbi:MAG: aromatic acid exporter family protein [Sedimentibacter sp.]
MNFPKIGMRNIKTSISVFLCLLIFEFINRDNAIHACIAAIICMQNTIDDSFKKGGERVFGTIIGGIAGVLILFTVKELGNEKLLLFIIPLGIIILIEICVSLKFKQSVVICCVVYLSILISKEHEGGYILYTINRIIDTTIGIMITIFVNKYLKVPDEVKVLVGLMKPHTEQKELSEITTAQCENESSKAVADIETVEKK